VRGYPSAKDLTRAPNLVSSIHDNPQLSPKLAAAIDRRFGGLYLPPKAVEKFAGAVSSFYRAWPKHHGSGRPLRFEELSASNAAVHATDPETLARKPAAPEQFLEDYLGLRKPYLRHTRALQKEFRPGTIEERREKKEDAVSCAVEALLATFKREGPLFKKAFNPESWIHDDTRTRKYLSTAVRRQGARNYWALRLGGLRSITSEKEKAKAKTLKDFKSSIIPSSKDGILLPRDEYLIGLLRGAIPEKYQDIIRPKVDAEEDLLSAYDPEKYFGLLFAEHRRWEPEAALLFKIRRERLEAVARETLPSRQLLVFLARLSDRRHTDIARELGISVRASISALNKATNNSRLVTRLTREGEIWKP
jgi:hypothetical protein